MFSVIAVISVFSVIAVMPVFSVIVVKPVSSENTSITAITVNWITENTGITASLKTLDH